MRGMTWLLLTTLLTGVAQARTEKPAIAPAPDWVKPVPLPGPSSSRPAKADEAAIRVLLADQQVRFEQGRVATYVDVALLIQAPQGLAAGNLSFPWNPEMDEIIVHKLVIHRDGKDIDVLANGQSFTVARREPNLEIATLDGMLTANIQPEGLQVGDVLEYAMTVTHSDPLFQNHVEDVGAQWNGLPFARAHLRVQWPSSMAVAIRQNGALPGVKPVKAGATTSVELSLDNVEPVLPPRLAPPRYTLGRSIEFSDFRSWADIGTLMAPLYAKAAVIPAQGPLRDEVEKIKAASADPVKRTEAALALVQDRVRYVALLMGNGGYVPANAEETWSRRYGDCKAKSALLLALLRELGVSAEPVAANAGAGDGIDQRLPMVGVFNHVLVRAHIGGTDYWLDGTRTGDASLARLRVPDFGWGLPLVETGAALVRMVPAVLERPDTDMTIAIDARQGITLPAPIKVTSTLRGDGALATRLAMAQLTEAQRDQALRDYWKGQIKDIEVKTVAARYDAETGEETLTMEGVANMDWSDGWYHADRVHLGYDADFSRQPGPDQDAPFANDYPDYWRTVETIQLPPGFPDDTEMANLAVDQTVAGTAYFRKASLVGNVFRIEASARVLASEFPAREAPAAQKALKALSDQQAAFQQSNRMTDAEIDNAKTETLSTAKDYVDRGVRFMNTDRLSDAERDFDAAIKLDAKYVWAFANRALVNIDLDDLTAAQRDIDAAAAIDPENSTLWHARGLIAFARNAIPDAIAAFSHSIANDPKDLWAIDQRAAAYQRAGNFDGALADTTALLALNPRDLRIYMARALLLRRLGQMEDALADAQAVMKVDPEKAAPHVAAAQIYYILGRSDEALKAIDQAIAIEPTVSSYIARIQFLPRSDVSGRKMAIDKAFQMEPDNFSVLLVKAMIEEDDGDHAAAIRIYSAMLAKSPKNLSVLNARGIAYTRAGDAVHAKADFAAARALAGGADQLNNLCYEKGMAGVALETALSECNAALAKLPNMAPTLDSRAFVMLRLGRLDEAIADYSAALAQNGDLAPSLLGRSIAFSRKGEKEKAATDRDAALKIDPNISRQFESYGVTP